MATQADVYLTASAQNGEYSGSGRSCHRQRQLLLFPPCSCEIRAAAPSSLIVAAFTPQRWLLLCLPPLLVAQNSQVGGESRPCRRALRRQIGENSPISPTSHPSIFPLPQQLRLFVARNRPFLRFRHSCQALHCITICCIFMK